MPLIDLKRRFSACPLAVRDAVLALAERVRSLPQDAMKPRALLVGGIVRDLSLDRPASDADMEIYGVPATQVRALLEELFPGRVRDVGRAFSVYHVVLEGSHGLDVSLPRRDSKTGAGHKGFDVHGDPAMSVENAARRRDFTINSLLADPLTGEVLDPFNGRSDLAHGVLRVTDAATFAEDPLRAYRALQFAARFNLKPDAETQRLLTKMVARGDLDQLPRERVTEELRKLLVKAETPSVGLELARDMGVIERDYPELNALASTPQEPEWHPEGNVWIHTMMAVDMAAQIIRREQLAGEDALIVMLGTLCHDLGKPATTQTLKGRIRSLEHESSGEAPTKSLLGRWTFGSDVEQSVIAIVKDHLKPMMLLREYEKGTLTDEQYANAVRRLLKRIHPLPWRTFLTACEADYRGRAVPELQTGSYAPGIIFAQAVERENLDQTPTKSLLSGDDLRALGIQPGPGMGRIIRAVEDARDRGEVKTKAEALALAKTLL